MAFSTHDIVPDSPTNNFATLNPLEVTNVSYSNGSLTHTQNSYIAGASHSSKSTISVPVGKFYWEALYNPTSKDNPAWGVLNAASIENMIAANSAAYMGDIVSYWPNNINTNNYYKNGSTLGVTGSNFTVGDIAMCCVEMFTDGTGKIWFGSNGNWFNGGTPNNSSNEITTLFGTLFPAFDSPGGENNIWIANFGQDPTFGGAKSPSTTYTDANGIGAFYYQPPTDALALCTANLPEMTPDVTGDVPADYFKAVTYTGDGNTNQSITSVGFQPDFLWIKNRDQTDWHNIVDSIRGATKRISSNNTTAEYDNAANVHSFLVDGFKVGNDHNTNASNEKYIAWCWKAGGAPTADNSNTSGAMTANSVSLNGTLQSNYTPAGSPTIYPKRMSINTDAGFSIVKYTGTGANATVPHGLSSAPDFIIIKSLDEGTTNYTGQWDVYHTSLGANKLIALNTTGAYTSPTNVWTATPDSNVITIGSAAAINYSNDNYIAYCWHSVENYSKFGSYTGNGSADGPFVYCGFRPAFVLRKVVNLSHGWYLDDSVRNPENMINDFIRADDSGVEALNDVNYGIDLLSNGFKVRSSHITQNKLDETYIFMAFAEQPFKFSNAR
jgi:hypothetical protein